MLVQVLLAEVVEVREAGDGLLLLFALNVDSEVVDDELLLLSMNLDGWRFFSNVFCNTSSLTCKSQIRFFDSFNYSFGENERKKKQNKKLEKILKLSY